jgi:hypothetical protein
VINQDVPDFASKCRADLLQELKFIRRIGPVQYEIAPGFVPHMRVPGTCYVNTDLEGLIFDELKAFCNSGGHGGFLPAVKQLANVAALPGIVQARRTRQDAAIPSWASLQPAWQLLRKIPRQQCPEMHAVWNICHHRISCCRNQLRFQTCILGTALPLGMWQLLTWGTLKQWYLLEAWALTSTAVSGSYAPTW